MPLVVPFQTPAHTVPTPPTRPLASSSPLASRATAQTTRSAQMQQQQQPPRTTSLALALSKNPTSTLHISITALTSAPRQQASAAPSSTASQKPTLTLMIHMTTTATITAPPQSTDTVTNGSSTIHNPESQADFGVDPPATSGPSITSALGSFVYALPPPSSSPGQQQQQQQQPLCTALVAVPSSIDFATRMAKAVCCKTGAAVYLSWSGRFGMLGGLPGDAAGGVGVGVAAAEQLGGGGTMLEVDEEMDAMRIAVEAIVRSVPS